MNNQNEYWRTLCEKSGVGTECLNENTCHIYSMYAEKGCEKLCDCKNNYIYPPETAEKILGLITFLGEYGDCQIGKYALNGWIVGFEGTEDYFQVATPTLPEGICKLITELISQNLIGKEKVREVSR